LPDNTTAILRAAASLDRLAVALHTGEATGEYLEAAYRDRAAALDAGATSDDINAARTPSLFDVAAAQTSDATPCDDSARRAAALILSAIAAKVQVSEDDLALELAVRAEDTATKARATVTGTTIDIDPDSFALLLDRLAREVTGRARHDTVLTLVDVMARDGYCGAFAWSAAGGFPALYSKQADAMLPTELCWWSDDSYIPYPLVDHLPAVLSDLSKWEFELSTRTAAVLKARGIRLN
jgi:hypothetical protein